MALMPFYLRVCDGLWGRYNGIDKGGWRTPAEIGSTATLTRRPDLGNASVGTSVYKGSRNGAGPFSCAGKESR